MLRSLRLLFVVLIRSVRSRRNLLLENLALRQQLGVFKQKHPQPRFAVPDKLFWVMLRQLWDGWIRALILVQPETVVRWHRTGFKLYWTWLSRHRKRVGRKCVSRSEEHTSELQSLRHLVCRLLLEKKKNRKRSSLESKIIRTSLSQPTRTRLR